MNLRSIRRRQYPKKGGGKNIGNRCKAYAAGCAICEAWRFRDIEGRFPYDYEELADFIERTVTYEDV